MATLSYTIPQEKAVEYIDDYIYIHKNIETIPDPEWVDPEDGTSAPQIAKYTDAQWIRDHILRYIKGQIQRGKNAKLRDAIVEADVSDVE